jgi:hypothetical protein
MAERRALASGVTTRICDVQASPLRVSGVRGEAGPRVGLNRNRSVISFYPDTPAARSVATSQRVGADLINVVTTWFARADRGLDCFDLVHVNDGLVSVAAEAVQGVACERDAPATGVRQKWRAMARRGLGVLLLCQRLFYAQQSDLGIQMIMEGDRYLYLGSPT